MEMAAVTHVNPSTQYLTATEGVGIRSFSPASRTDLFQELDLLERSLVKLLHGLLSTTSWLQDKYCDISA